VKKLSILMVCTANICRSPMAEGLLLLHAGRAGLGKALVVQSAGTHVKLGGQRPDARAQRAAASLGADLGRLRSRQVQGRDFIRHDLILGMDAGNKRYLLEACPAEHTHKVALLLDFAPETGTGEVPDPYFGNYVGFERVLELLEAGVAGLLRHVQTRRFL
jgi:protein-tyrosine phosphatase